MNKETKIEIINRAGCTIGYSIPELSVKRTLADKQRKEITFEELEQLFFVPGGRRMITENLIVNSKEALQELGIEVEPEYFYTDEEVVNLLQHGDLNSFLDCLDFAPAGVIDIIKDKAVELELNDYSKRNAIYEKTGFNINNAIEIKNTKFDDGSDEIKENKPVRRVAIPKENTIQRRAAAPTTETVASAPRKIIVKK